MSETYTYEAHVPIKSRAYPWLRCRYCGLLYLKNEVTQLAIRLGCNHALSNEWKNLK